MSDWISIDPTSGRGKTAITFTPTGYNTSGSIRGDTVVFRNPVTEEIAVLYFRQEPLPDNTLIDSEGYVLLDSEGYILQSND